jgi:hypothetical protein
MASTQALAKLAIAAGLAFAAMAPANAQYRPYPPGTHGQYAHACFPADQRSGYLRIEWPQSGRWALFNWPYGSNIRIFIGPEPAVWCWSANLRELFRPCRPGFTQTVVPGC